MAAKVNEGKCVGCGSCESACPVEAIKVEVGKAKVSGDCIECGACVSECPVEAISI
jgi:NAD-dependent dihydropyrimidine dehydrogenase PreA subunit